MWCPISSIANQVAATVATDGNVSGGGQQPTPDSNINRRNNGKRTKPRPLPDNLQLATGDILIVLRIDFRVEGIAFSWDYADYYT